jgi:hypothetical protein
MQKGTPGCTRTFPTYIAFSPTSARPPQCIQPLYQACKSIAFSTSSILGSAALHNRHRRGAYTHIGAQPPCSTNIMPMMQHVHRGSRPHRSFHHTVGTIVPWTVLHDVNPSCPIVTTVAPLLFSFFDIPSFGFHPSRMSCGFTCQGFFPHLLSNLRGRM